jgi:RNA polymerase sigma factor (sigma-70 family)
MIDPRVPRFEPGSGGSCATCTQNSVRAHLLPGRSPLNGLLAPNGEGRSDSTSNGGALDPIANGSTPSLNLRSEESKERIEQALHKLKPRDQQLVQLLFFEKKSIREAAEILSLDESTVRYHLPLILECLRDDLQGLQ